MRSLDHESVLELLPNRKLNTHKGHYGKLLLLCGSKGYTGAAALAAMGALRAGAGLVYLGVPKAIYEIEAIKLLEPIVFPLPDFDGKFSEDCIYDVIASLKDKDAVLIGPGIGKSEGTYKTVKAVLENFCGPVVLDADGINVICQHKDVIRERTSPTILTPHEGEFERIYGKIDTDRVTCANLLAKELQCVVLLKGNQSIITDGRTTFLNPTGNPGMAVGGSGDVLAGIITALLGQGLPALDAAACGAWLHGAAGDICAKEIGQYGMLPSDILLVLPRLLK